MNRIFDEAERELLRAAAHLAPANIRRALDLVAEDSPPTPAATIPAPTDEAVARLRKIEHVVVLMQENRSFDHMLAYLSLPQAQGGRGRTDVDGLKGPDQNVNTYSGVPYPIHHETRTKFDSEAEDPDHSAAAVDEQLSDENGGFVSSFAKYSAGKAEQLGVPVPDPGS